MSLGSVAILHYTAPPIIGGVEAVIAAQVRTFARAGCPVSVIAGRGTADALPDAAAFMHIATVDSRHEYIMPLSETLDRGQVPDVFEDQVEALVQDLTPVLSQFDHTIVHNVLTKHFNLPLTVALHRLIDNGGIRHCIAWCHDFTWTSPRSRNKVYPRYPWDLLRRYRPDVTYVTVSRRRQQALAELFDCPPERIHVVYNGVDSGDILGISSTGQALIERLGLLESDLTLLMPVRVTQAKYIEYALRTVAALKAQGMRPKLVVTGPPDPHDEKSMAYYNSLRALRAELGVEQEARFVFESGPDPEQGFTIAAHVVGDLLRVSDVMFMPSHREGFGMPVLEAGLAGVAVVCTDIPAAVEIGGHDVLRFDAEQEPRQVARMMVQWLEQHPPARLRRRVRQTYTWQRIFEQDVRPLLERGRST